MTEGVAESWARLRLVQGDSSDDVRELGSTAELVTLTVGSEPESTWVVKEEGVKPLHFSLHWDGDTLRIADTHGAGDVRVDGQLATAQWRSVSGRVRIEFGKAAIVAETSAAPVSDAQPSPSPLPPITGTGSEAPPAARVHKATLIGVSPLGGVTAQVVSVRAEPAAGGSSEAAASGERSERVSSPPGGFSVTRAPETERQRKHTLLGMAINIPDLLASAPAASSGEAAKKESQGEGEKNPKPSAPAAEVEPAKKSAMSGTLIGVANPVSLLRGAQRFAPAGSDVAPVVESAAEPGAKLALPRSDAPAGATTQNEVRAVSPPEPSGGSIGTAWQEVPSPDGTPRAVLLNSSDDVDPSMRMPAYDRRTEASQQVAAIDAQEEKRAFPWRYVGIGLLTAAAYFAWLYLLDHL